MLIDLMEKLGRHIFGAITQFRSSKKQPNESLIITHLSEKLEQLNSDKTRQTRRSKRLAKYT